MDGMEAKATETQDQQLTLKLDSTGSDSGWSAT